MFKLKYYTDAQEADMLLRLKTQSQTKYFLEPATTINFETYGLSSLEVNIFNKVPRCNYSKQRKKYHTLATNTL